MSVLEVEGKFRSEQTLDDYLHLMQEELKALSPEERDVLLWLLEDYETKNTLPIAVTQLEKTAYLREPVPMRQFLLDDYYLGDTCKGIYPRLLDDLEEIFSGTYREVIFTGSIGVGKTFVCAAGMCRVLYELSCMVDPQRAFGLTPETPIFLAGISASEDLAKEVVMKNIVGKIASSPYFREHFSFKITQKAIRFPNNVAVIARATTPQSVLGMAILASLVDEANFMPIRKASKQLARFGSSNLAQVIHDSIKRRMYSRYGCKGKLFLPASKSTTDSFLSDRIKEAETDPTIFIRDYALWDVRPGDFTEKRFYVLCGNEQVNSKVLDSNEVAQVRDNLPDRTVLLAVPDEAELRRAFEADLEGSIRDLGGLSTVGMSPFIQRRVKLKEMIDETRIHPFSTEVYEPDVGGNFMESCMVRTVMHRIFDGSQVAMKTPILNPGAPRAVHLDMAVRDCAAGFCMGHVARWATIERASPDMKIYTIEAPFFVIDLVLKILPPAGADLDFAIFEMLIHDLLDIGYPISIVTADQWQSISTLQRLNKRGLKTGEVSLDRTWDAYRHAKQALYEGRVSCYAYSPLLKELSDLEVDWTRKKVFKKEGLSKDVADSFAAVLYDLERIRDTGYFGVFKGISSYGEAPGESLVLQATGGLIPVGSQESGSRPPKSSKMSTEPFLPISRGVGRREDDW